MNYRCFNALSIHSNEELMAYKKDNPEKVVIHGDYIGNLPDFYSFTSVKILTIFKDFPWNSIYRNNWGLISDLSIVMTECPKKERLYAPNVRILRMAFNKIDESDECFMDLTGVPYLEELLLKGPAKYRGLESICKLSKFRMLSLGSKYCLREEDMPALSQLEHLSLDCVFNGYSFLQKYESLKTFTARDYSECDLSSLKGLNKLEEITIRRGNIEDISCLEDLPNLRRVTITGNPIKHIGNLSIRNDIELMIMVG